MKLSTVQGVICNMGVLLVREGWNETLATAALHPKYAAAE
jgi:hypothetical protein